MKAAVTVVVMAVTLPGTAGAWNEPPVAVSPGSATGTVIADPCPTFSWSGTEGAAAFELALYRVEGNSEVTGGSPDETEPTLLTQVRLPGGATGWTPSLGQCLERGGTYAWSVGAEGTAQETEWSDFLYFRVAPGPSEEDFQRALLLVERYLGVRRGGEDAPGSPSAAAERPGAKRGEPSLEPRALGGADFSIDSSGNVAGLSFTGDGSGLANVTAADLVGNACVSEAELDFDPATQTELADHAALSSVHHVPTVDTSCTVTDNGDGTAKLACDDGSSVRLQVIKAVAVSAGHNHTCALLADRSVVCWGDDFYGQSSAPAGTFIQVSAGGFHTCGLTEDEHVACWGYDGYGQSSPTSPATFTQVSAGMEHTCGVESHDTVECWGKDEWGETVPPAAVFIQVSAGAYHSCGVKSDGSVACWGDDYYRQSSPPAGTFTQVSAGDNHTCGVKSDGLVACWGYDAYGQSSPPTGTFAQVSAGGAHTCGVQTNGSGICWGSDYHGQSTPPPGTFAQVSAGSLHTCGVQPYGSVACWGSDAEGKSTVPTMLQ